MITRRRFLGSLSAVPVLDAVRSMSGRGSALAATLDGAGTNQRTRHAIFHSLPPGVVKPDGWTVVTRDGSLSAHFEHTVAVTDSGPQILTTI